MKRADHDPSTGEPIAQLADYEQQHSAALIGRVRNRLHRRLTTNQLASMSWNAPGQAIVEFLDMLFSLFQPAGKKKGEDR